MDKKKMPASKNFEDRSTPYWKFISKRFDDWMLNTGLAERVSDDPSFPILYKLNGNPQAKGYTASPNSLWGTDYGDVELTPEEKKAHEEHNMSLRDMMLFRAYKQLPSLVGK